MRGETVNIITEKLHLQTQGNSEVFNITDDVESVLKKSNLTNGNVTVFVVGSTAAITTTEFEPGLRRDLPEMFERIAPHKIRYYHDDTWHDGNGHSHVRASLLGPSLVVPFTDGKLVLGTWQQIVLIDFDIHSRQREVVVQLIGN
jgi:secondary thiamine-phosphate synthase enzyme